MSTIDYFVVLHCTVDGENGEQLGSDESHLNYINCQFVDVSLNKVVHGYNFQLKKSLDDSSLGCTDVSKSLKQALEKIDKKILELSEGGCKQIYFAVDGILQLRQCLLPQATRSGIELDKHYYAFYDIRKECRVWSGNQRLNTMEDIAEDCCIPEANFMNNISEACQLCTKVVMKLINNGHKFQSPEVIMKQLKPGLTSGYVKDETITKVRGLPWQVSDHDVATFFIGLDIVRGGVALCLNSKGRRNGEAFVRFESEEQRNCALKRHKHHLSGRYIEVYKGSAQEFLKIARGPSGAMNATTSFFDKGGKVLIRMRGLPYTAVAKDVLEFFGANIPIFNGENGIMFVHHADGTATGDAFAMFHAEEDGIKALKKHKEKIGTRYVELFRSTQAELQQVLTMYNVGYQFVSPVGMISPLMPPMLSINNGTMPSKILETNAKNERVNVLMSMSCLRLRGLPFSATKDDILKFLLKFSNGIIGNMHFIYNIQGRPSGECLIQMKSVDIAHKAANDLHLKHIGERYIEVFQCSVHDMRLMLATSHANQMSAYMMHSNNNSNSNNNNSNSNNNNNTCFHPGPTHAQHSPRLLPPSASTTFIPPIMSTVPTVFNNNYQQISPALNTPCVFPPLPFPLAAPLIPAETVNYQMNSYGKPNGMACLAFHMPSQSHRASFDEYSRQPNDSNKSAEIFSA